MLDDTEEIMARHKADLTRKEIIQVATHMFLENGYSHTTAKAICKELDMSTGNLTFHYPTKEHLLAKLTEMLCHFQGKMMEKVIDEGKTSLLALCMELAAMAAICEENEIAKDFYLSAYTHTMSLDLIRRSDLERAKVVFGEYAKDWPESQFHQAEIIVSGIEYATLMKTDDTSLEDRIAGALNGIMIIYGVPQEVRHRKIKKVLEMDYKTVGRNVLEEFKKYVSAEVE